MRLAGAAESASMSVAARCALSRSMGACGNSRGGTSHCTSAEWWQGVPEGCAGKSGEVRDALSPCEAAQVVEPQGMHKMVERQCYCQIVPSPPQTSSQEHNLTWLMRHVRSNTSHGPCCLAVSASRSVVQSGLTF